MTNTHHATKARLERLQAASDSISTALMEELSEQGKKAAANMLQLYGSKSCLDAGGFIYCIQNAHEAALLFLLEDGFVALNESGRASGEEIEERQNKRKLTEGLIKEAVPTLGDHRPGDYL